MRRGSCLGVLAVGLLVGSAAAQVSLPFFDSFENGLSLWYRWPEATESLQLDEGHSSSPTHAAKAVEADPWGYASFADFGPQAGSVYAEVLVFDDFDDKGTDRDRPVSNMLALIGASDRPDDWTDWLQLGVVAWCDPGGLTQKYYIRTRHRDVQAPPINCLDTGVYRRHGWIKLGIWADAWADGGQVRFYIDDVLVGTSQRSLDDWGDPVDLQFVRLGLNFKSYDSQWYDNVRVAESPCGTPRQDVNGDGSVDGTDYGVFSSCFNGSGNIASAACQCLDADADGDVDGVDFGVFSSCFNGAGNPPGC